MKIFILVLTVLAYLVILYSLTSCTLASPPQAKIPVLTAPATPLQCPAGGTVVTVGVTPVIVCNGLQGNQGATGGQGSTGTVGNTGVQGPAGTPGTPGVDLTPITMVQFCPASTTYPSTFSEIGLCIAGNLYAVYSANDGFLTYLPPGTYTSNGINSACTFTVGLDCEVTP